MITRVVYDGVEPSTTQSLALSTIGDVVIVSVDVTNITGTLDVTVEWSPDGTNWAAGGPDAITQFTATGVGNGRFDAKAPYHRLVYTIGTGPVTFKAVTAQTAR